MTNLPNSFSMQSVYIITYLHIFSIQGIEFSLPFIEETRNRKQRSSETNLEAEVAKNSEVGKHTEDEEYVICLKSLDVLI